MLKIFDRFRSHLSFDRLLRLLDPLKVKEMPKYYAVRNGRSPGIYESWDDCKEQTNGYSNAQFKSFNSAEEADQYMSGSNPFQSSSYDKNTSSSYGNSYDDSPDDYYHNSCGNSSSSSRGPNEQRLKIFTDGACSNNGFGGAKAGIGVHFPHDPRCDISEPLSGRQTNNRAEIWAATRALEKAKQMGYTNVEINTDSQFLHSSVNEWLPNWKSKGWKKSDGTDVINKEDFQELEKASKGMDIKWQKVAAHKGIAGNEEADRLANKGMESRRLK